jgi:hypothetical protein
MSRQDRCRDWMLYRRPRCSRGMRKWKLGTTGKWDTGKRRCNARVDIMYVHTMQARRGRIAPRCSPGPLGPMGLPELPSTRQRSQGSRLHESPVELSRMNVSGPMNDQEVGEVREVSGDIAIRLAPTVRKQQEIDVRPKS